MTTILYLSFRYSSRVRMIIQLPNVSKQQYIFESTYWHFNEIYDVCRYVLLIQYQVYALWNDEIYHPQFTRHLNIMKDHFEYLFHTLFVVYTHFVKKIPTITFFNIKWNWTLAFTVAICCNENLIKTESAALQWHPNERDGFSNHQRLYSLLKCLFRHRSKKTSKLHITGLCAGNSLMTDEFPAQRASNMENVSIWWRHHVWYFCCISTAIMNAIISLQMCYRSAKSN